MTRKLSYAVLTLAMAGGMAVSSAGAASAAHCVSPEKDSPGFSYFGNDHVAGDAKDAETRDSQREQGDGSAGASACPASGNPSERSSGKQ